MPDWTHILVHHTAGTDRVLRDFDAIRRYHMDERGWQDIGYHAVIEGVAGVMVTIPGRPHSMAGAHCPSWNTRALGVAVVGNFNHEPFREDQMRELGHFCVTWCAFYGIPAVNIHGHRDHRDTDCPGSNLYLALPRLRQIVAAKIGAF